jgi:hypothetical protein
MEAIVLNINDIKIDIRDKKSIYITIGEWTVYLDDGTRERIITDWYKNGKSKTIYRKHRKNN